jgi:hypothetical protein
MQTVDWFWLIHPVVAVVVVYPLLGMVVRLGLQARSRRLGEKKLPVSSGRDHADLGRWLSAGVVGAVLAALIVVIASKVLLGESPGGLPRIGLLALVSAGTAMSFVCLWQVKRAGLRAAFALLCWAGLIGLGLQPEVWRLGDNPFQPAFWQSHFWGGVGLCGLMLFSLASKPETLRSLRWRRLHVSANVLAALVFLAQGISGPRDLLEIPLHWQKPAIQACDFAAQQCPAATPNQP